MKTDCEILKSRIADLCKAKGINKTTAFTESGVGKNFISNLSIANPSMEKLTLLANYFDVSVDYLLGRESAPSIKNFVMEGSSSDEEQEILRAYRSAPEYIKMAVRDLLKVESKVKDVVS